MKKLLLTRLVVCLCALFSSISAFAEAGWVGAGAINVNGTWYRADEHESNGWAFALGGNFNEATIISTTLELGGQVRLWDVASANWGQGTAYMCYRIDEGEYENLALIYYHYDEDKKHNLFQSGGGDFTAETIDISGLSWGTHTLTVKFVDCDGLKPTAEFTANFIKGYDINDATVTGVNASYAWTGSAIKPEPVVTYSGTPLTASTDYDVTYSEGCINVGTYTVTIEGKGDYYAGTKVINYDILVSTGYYLVGTMNSWELNSNYKLTQDTENTVQYYINNVMLSAGDELKVAYTEDGKTKKNHYPENQDNYGINETGNYLIYFRPDYAGSGWYWGTIRATTEINVALAPAGYATYYNSAYEVTLPSGTVAYVLNDVANASSDPTPSYEMIADGNGATTTVPAGVAVLLYNSSKPSQVTLTLNTVRSDARTFGSNKLHGSDVETTTTGGDKYYKLTYAQNDSRFGWFWGASEGAAFTSPAHKVWVALSIEESESARTFLTLPGEGDATGISTIESKQTMGNVWYDLNGRRVSAPTTKGIYVKDGRKIVVK